MELKSFIRTLKMQRGRYAKNPNAEAEKKTIENLAEKIGGKLEAIAQLKEAGEDELKDYIKGVFGVKTIVDEMEPAPTTDTEEVEVVDETLVTGGKKKVGRPKKEDKQYGRDEKGVLYEIDTVKKTCKKVYHDLKDLKYEDLDIPEMSLNTYQRYLKDKFPGETCTLKRGKLMFRDYRITLTIQDGFMVEDVRKHYEVVDTPWEGIPTPAELGEWFKNPTRHELTDAEKIQEHFAAIEAGKKAKYEKKRERERLAAEAEKAREEAENIDFEACRKKVLRKIEEIRTKVDTVFNPEGFADMIPFKRWRRQCKSLLTKWKNKNIRYAKFLKELERITTEETFVIKEKNHRSAFKGAMLPDHKKVGYLRGDKLEVDDKLVDAVPFLMDYLLHYEPKAMSQIMKYAKGEITDRELIENPIVVDWKEEYKKKSLPNTAHNARVLTCVYESCGLIAPQDLLFESDLVPGDVILVYFEGKLRRKTVANVDKGVILGKEVGLLKTDKWILAPKKETDETEEDED